VLDFVHPPITESSGKLACLWEEVGGKKVLAIAFGLSCCSAICLTGDPEWFCAGLAKITQCSIQPAHFST
jgi:hypothetical protein